MPLSDESRFGLVPMTQAINNIAPMPTAIRESKLFRPEYLEGTHIDVEVSNEEVLLVEAVPRGTPGKPVENDDVTFRTFKTLHLPQDDVVLADDVINVRQFGTNNQKATVEGKVNAKLAKMKRKTENSREHLMLGAIQGKVVNAKTNKVLVDINKEFGIDRKYYDIKFSDKTTDVGMLWDDCILEQADNAGGELITGWTVYASKTFLKNMKWHPSMKELYKLFQDAAALKGEDRASFVFGDTKFVLYNHKFNSDVDIKDGEALLVPEGTTETFIEYFAPGDMTDVVGTTALPYYASREPMKHKKGWDLHTQSNPLPLMLRPKLGATFRST